MLSGLQIVSFALFVSPISLFCGFAGPLVGYSATLVLLPLLFGALDFPLYDSLFLVSLCDIVTFLVAAVCGRLKKKLNLVDATLFAVLSILVAFPLALFESSFVLWYLGTFIKASLGLFNLVLGIVVLLTAIAYGIILKWRSRSSRSHSSYLAGGYREVAVGVGVVEPTLVDDELFGITSVADGDPFTIDLDEPELEIDLEKGAIDPSRSPEPEGTASSDSSGSYKSLETISPAMMHMVAPSADYSNTADADVDVDAISGTLPTNEELNGEYDALMGWGSGSTGINDLDTDPIPLFPTAATLTAGSSQSSLQSVWGRFRQKCTFSWSLVLSCGVVLLVAVIHGLTGVCLGWITALSLWGSRRQMLRDAFACASAVSVFLALVLIFVCLQYVSATQWWYLIPLMVIPAALGSMIGALIPPLHVIRILVCVTIGCIHLGIALVLNAQLAWFGLDGRVSNEFPLPKPTCDDQAC